MTDFVPTHIRACPDCLARKSPNNRREPMGHVPVSSKWERVARDILDTAPVPEPIWVAVPGPREDSLVASSVPPHTLCVPPEEDVILENHPICGEPPVAVQKPGPDGNGGHSKRQGRSGRTMMSPPSSPRLPSPRVKKQSGKRKDFPVDLLDRGNPRCLDYKGFRFSNIDSLYLGMMVECLGFPNKTRQIAKHRKMSVSVAMAMDCCVKATIPMMTQWHIIHHDSQGYNVSLLFDPFGLFEGSSRGCQA